ncbi:hypothetical protein [Kitasatospora sp. NPDC097643]|uniref:hypothetical protein n=1 Tax=Kitasatospora sp. NPDC097643 TaxID=3157230 RepID=UPI00331F5DF1
MRRFLMCTAMVAASLVGLAAAPASAAPAQAGTGTDNGRWEPWPSPSFDLPAGSRCDFPVHLAPVVDQVERRVLETDADGKATKVAFRGALVMRVTNTTTGARYDADAGGRSVVEYHADGSQTWRAHGPILLGFGANAGTLARDLYTVDGVYTVDISATGYRTLVIRHGSATPLCGLVS